MAKLFSFRLKVVLPGIINDNQTTFVAGRQILDGFLIANDLFRELWRRGGHEFLFKIDFHKAFDSFSWEYLDEVLHLKTPYSTRIVTGPFSPFLFDIAVEDPSVLFHQENTSVICSISMTLWSSYPIIITLVREKGLCDGLRLLRVWDWFSQKLHSCY